ncbi:MAG: hypothetical protein NTZ20_02995 [Candidatus Levybacteria bacterium]|nr:hypothetical protein [Candidatus Levybacteria bacterium]
MKLKLENFIDARQTPQWAKFMQSIGWIVERIGNTHVFIRKLPYMNFSVIKIQHPLGPVPFKKIDLIAKKYNAIFVIIEPHPYKYNEVNYIKYGYRLSNFLFAHSATLKIDITLSEKNIFSTFSENAKRNIKKAKDKNLIISSVFLNSKKDNKSFEVFFKLLKNLSDMKKFYIPNYEEFYKKMVAFSKHSFLLFARESKNGPPIAVVWYAYYDGVLSYLQTGITKRGYETLANYLLVWEGIRLGKKLKKKILDFESIFDPRYPTMNKKWKNYTEFKKRFHGREILFPLPQIKCYGFFSKFIYIIGTLFTPAPKIIYLSEINNKIEVKKFLGKKTIFSDGPQSGGEFVFMWTTVIRKLKKIHTSFSNCLVLGVCGGDVIRAILKYYPDSIIRGVEIDPVMITIAKEHFELDIKSHPIDIEDAISWVNKHKKLIKKYDLIIVDLFIGPLNPQEARNKNYLLDIASLLNPKGVIIFNAHYQEKKPQDFDKFQNNCKEIFSQVELLFIYRLNRVILLTNPI